MSFQIKNLKSKMVANAENEFDYLINMRKRFKEPEINKNKCSTEYLIDILIKNPLLIMLLIIIDIRDSDRF